jgi:hypothetical protein
MTARPDILQNSNPFCEYRDFFFHFTAMFVPDFEHVNALPVQRIKKI